MDELFNRGGNIVTTDTIIYRSKSYATKSIVNITDTRQSPDILKLIMYLFLLIIGVFGCLTGILIWVILGLVAIGFGIANCYDIIKQKHFRVIVLLSSGEKLDFDLPKIETAIDLKDALIKAKSLN